MAAPAGASSLPFSRRACFDIMLSEREAAEDTPSRKDGISKAIEASLRKSYVALIQDVCVRFQTHMDVPMIATIYCHRFYAARSFQRNDRFIVATAALFLAYKVSDICPHIKTVMEVCHAVFSRSKNKNHTTEQTKRMFQEHPEFYQSMKKKVLAAERSILYVVGFSFKPELPRSHFFPKINKLKATPEEKAQLRQICVNFANDSLKTTLWLQYTPSELANAFIYVTAELACITLVWPDRQNENGDKEWYEDEGMDVLKMTKISNQLLDLYAKQKVPKSGSKRRVMPPTPELSASNSAMAHDAERNAKTEPSRCDAKQNDKKAVPEPASVAAV